MISRLRRRIVPWFVISTKPRKELWAAENVENQGAETYLPRISKTEVLFPGYLFVCTDGTWHFLRGTFGVSHVIMVGSAPAKLSHHAIEEIRGLENTEGLIVVPDWVKGRRALCHGEKVEVLAGPFMGSVGLYQGMKPNERAQALLHVLGRETLVEMDYEDLERVTKL